MNGEIYVSTDVETDGPLPGVNSMLSLGSAAFRVAGREKHLVSTFSVNLETLPEASPNPRTMEWWAGQPEAWSACRRNPEDPASAMARYAAWLHGLGDLPVFVAWPLGFDYFFVHWYMIRFTGSDPFRRNGIDMRSFAMAQLHRDYRASGKKALPRRWFDEAPHTHVALDDAIEQGALFCNMAIENREGGCRETDGKAPAGPAAPGGES